MAVFALFRYNLSKAKGQELKLVFSDEEGEHKFKSKNELFESFFPDYGKEVKIGEVVEKSRGKDTETELVSHITSIEAHSNNIIILRFQANKKRKINHEDWTSEPVDHHPDLRIIIDNRSGSQIIAVEKKKSVMSVEKAMELLTGWLRIRFNDKGVRMDYVQLSKTVDFWDGVYEIQRITHDKMKYVKFCFVKDEEQTTDDKTFVALLQQWMNLFGKSGSLTVDIENDEHLKKVHDDLTRMARLCYANSRYNLEVMFNTFGVYRYGQDVTAQYGLEDCVIESFCPHYYNADAFDTEDPKDKLINWLNTVNELFEGYGATASTEQRRKTYGRI